MVEELREHLDALSSLSKSFGCCPQELDSAVVTRFHAGRIAATKVALGGFLCQGVHLYTSIDAGGDTVHAADTIILFHVESPFLILDYGICGACSLT